MATVKKSVKKAQTGGTYYASSKGRVGRLSGSKIGDDISAIQNESMDTTGYAKGKKDMQPKVIPSETDKAWMAGFVDGEGSIMLMYNKPNQKTGHKSAAWSFKLSISNTKIESLKEFEKL